MLTKEKSISTHIPVQLVAKSLQVLVLLNASNHWLVSIFNLNCIAHIVC